MCPSLCFISLFDFVGIEYRSDIQYFQHLLLASESISIEEFGAMLSSSLLMKCVQ